MASLDKKDDCMERTLKTQSLLPWLEPGSSKIHLEISLQNTSLQTHGPPGDLFRLLSSSSPLFHLIHGSYKTPSGTLVKEVFLLVQKDHCSFTEQNTPFNNSRIDTIWREACACADIADGVASFDCLCDSSADAKSFPLWRSLFYCAARRCYFHPPCPQCGHLLELCRDDALLSAAGLSSYATTLERFLFCPVCHAAQTATDFFTHDDGKNVSHLVKSRQALLAGFEQLVKNGSAGEDLPCRTCPELDDCYGAARVFSRIHSVAFYPFRMLITDGAQLPARDFMHMLAGASYAAINKQPPIVREPKVILPKESACVENIKQQMPAGIQLFFANDSRRFLEISYLKLAFLEQITTAVFKAQKHLKHPDLRLSMEQFWVELPAEEGVLPFFWNFTVKPIALGIFPAEDVASIRVPESLGLYSLALMWFETLLVNREQSAADVHKALAVLLDEEENSSERPDFFPDSTADGVVFDPGNVFWQPTPQQLPGMWFGLWRQALGLGWTILQASFRARHFREDAFVDSLRCLADDVKKTLFAPEPAVERSTKEDLVEGREDVDSAILHILVALQEKWQDEGQEDTRNDTAAVPAEVAAEIEPVVENDFSAEEELEKTVIINLHDLGSILSDKNASGMASKQPEAASQPKNIAEDDISETVIISLEELEKLRKGKDGHK